MTESVELTTIWLVDLVGSARLATTVGPVRADELRDEYFSLLREAINACQGRVFKNTGDGMFAAFSSASAAVKCAVLTQQLIERRYRGAEQRLQVRIGLGTGESTLKDNDYFGMPSIEAARLCDLAPAGGILVSAATQMLAGRADGVRFDSVGALELKGIPEPIEAFAVGWEPLTDESGMAVGGWALPEALRVVPRIAYVGREDERGLVEVARRKARSGTRQMVMLSGEPGIGKTRLASYAALGAHAEGFAVCWGACTDDLAVPYEPWVAICSQLVEHIPREVLIDHVAAFGGEISRLAGNLARRHHDAPAPQVSDPETERFLLFKAVAELLRAVADAMPLCVVLEDLHWADGQTVALLKHVARSVERGSLLLLMTYRDSELGQDHPLTALLPDLRRLDGVDRIALTGWDVDEVAQVLRAGAGHDLDAEAFALAAEIASETDGNPFFVGEILRNLTESGGISFDEAAGRWHVDLAAVSSLPASVRDVVGRRVDRLGQDGREVLTAAAVVGRTFDLRILAELIDLPEGQILDLLEAAVDATLVRESTEVVGRFSFEHALINHTLYQALGATRRATLHHRVALALETVFGDDSDEHLTDLALHWRLATVAVDTDKAASYAVRAGQQALDNLAPSEAARLFSDAVVLLGEGHGRPRCEALIGLGTAQRLTGDPAHRQTLLDACRIAVELREGELAARAALANSRGWVPSAFGQVDGERVAAIEQALALDTDPDRRARLLSLQALELLYEHDHHHRRELAERAVTLARQLNNPSTTAVVLGNWFQVFDAPDALAARRARLDELLAAVRAAGDPALEYGAARREKEVMGESGELARAEAAWQRLAVIGERIGSPTDRWFTALTLGLLAGLRGDTEESERCAEDALRLSTESGDPEALTFYGIQLLHTRMQQGRAAEVIDTFEQSARANPLLPGFKAGLALNLCWLGRHEEAAALVAEAAADRFEHVPWELTRLTTLALYADAAAQTLSVDAARVLYELIDPWSDQIVWNGASAHGPARLYLALLAATLDRPEQADEHFTRAIEIQKRDRMLFYLARTHLGWAEAFARRGESASAREQATCALQLAQAHGYGFVQSRAASLLDTRSQAIHG